MTLALLAGRCGDELICDMAETYHVLNWRELPLKTAAILASGLHQDSRCRMKLNGMKLRSEEYTAMAILDEVRFFHWNMLPKEFKKGRKKPESVLLKMLRMEDRPDVTGFRTPEEFEARRKQIAGE